MNGFMKKFAAFGFVLLTAAVCCGQCGYPGYSGCPTCPTCPTYSSGPVYSGPGVVYGRPQAVPSTRTYTTTVPKTPATTQTPPLPPTGPSQKKPAGTKTDISALATRADLVSVGNQLAARLDKKAEKAEIAVLQEQLTVITESLSKIDGSAATDSESNRDVLLEIQRLRGEIASLTNTVDIIKKDMDGLHSKVTNLTVLTQRNAGTLDALKALVNNNGKKLDTVTTKIHDVILLQQRNSSSQVNLVREALKGGSVKFRMIVDPNTGEVQLQQ